MKRVDIFANTTTHHPPFDMFSKSTKNQGVFNTRISGA